jgi:TusE/DsrC/DsvC family sulfur relay protein
MLTINTARISADNQPYERLDNEGYLVDTHEWTPAFTERKAQLAQITLTSRHWLLIEMIRDKYLRLGALPPMRTVCRSVGLNKADLKAQFGSCLKLWKIAGLPNPGEEAKAYMN